MTFKELKVKAKSFEAGDLKLAVAGDVATQFLVTALKGALRCRDLGGELFEAPYNQVVRQVSIEDSELRRFDPDFVVVWECVEHWWSRCESPEDRLNAVRSLCDSFPKTVLYVNAAPYMDGVWGNYAATESFAVEVRKFNTDLDVLATERSNLGIIDLNGLVGLIGRNHAFDPTMFAMSDMPLVPDAQARLAELIADSIAARRGMVRKCVVVDLDNTIWGGVVGEDGLEHLQIGDGAIGKVYAGIQRWLLRLKKRGIILTVCSKNDETVAREVFDRHPEMLLRFDDFACFVANWKTKADNIDYIKRVLNIGFDSMVFLDDNPAEREIVRTAHPEVVVPELPNDPAQWLDYLAAGNYFETATASKEDANRTRQYQEEAKRQTWKATFTSQSAYLESLDMEAETLPLDPFSIPRVAQLLQRTNQFNLRTIRHGEEVLRNMMGSGDFEAAVFGLSDKFGDYGIVSAWIGRIDAHSMFIDTWIMSCRVLGRGLEWYALNELVKRAKARGIRIIEGEYIPTRKNGQVADLYIKAGFEKISDGKFRLEVENYQRKETKIHEKKR